MSGQTRRYDEPADHDSRTLKVCDLCGAVNQASRPDCFVCGWHGHFTFDPDCVQRAQTDMQADNEQPDQFIYHPHDEARSEVSLLSRFMNRLRRLFIEDS